MPLFGLYNLLLPVHENFHGKYSLIHIFFQMDEWKGAKKVRAAIIRVAQELETYDRRVSHDEVVDICVGTTPSQLGNLIFSLYFVVVALDCLSWLSYVLFYVLCFTCSSDLGIFVRALHVFMQWLCGTQTMDAFGQCFGG